MIHMDEDEKWMKAAVQEAEYAYEKGEVPVGAVAIWRNQMIGKAHNQRELLLDPTAHAEMLAITQAATALESWRLEDVTLYVTLEPCAMCAGAIIQSRIPRVVFGAFDEKGGCYGSVLDLGKTPGFNHYPEVTGGLMQAECSSLLSSFFQDRRKEGKK